MRLRAASDVSECCLPFGAPVDPRSMIVDDGSPLEIIGYSDLRVSSGLGDEVIWFYLVNFLARLNNNSNNNGNNNNSSSSNNYNNNDNNNNNNNNNNIIIINNNDYNNITTTTKRDEMTRLLEISWGDP